MGSNGSWVRGFGRFAAVLAGAGAPAAAVVLFSGGAVAAGPAGAQDLPVVTPEAGMVIERSVRVAPGRYRLPAPADGPALTIRGEGLTVDFTGVTLEGADPVADPDGYTGTAVLIDGGSRVTVRGATIRGYKVAVHARRSPRLHLTGLDLSYNWKPRLWSGIEKESLVDWMSFHDNETDQWLRFGAAIYLSECDEAEVDHNRAVQGQNGLMVTRSARLRIWNNDFSFNSGIGLGLYRTSDSRILSNRLDWNVRGYSHGFYYRGQDSASLLMYEQTSRNVVAFNSATHGGDGLFLWAGQSTMDTGEGGSNDNYFFANDFSHAVANGIEATFSRNRFIENRIEDCWHGVWGGYSYDSSFARNRFARNDEAIAIEHGQNIDITLNTFAGDGTAVRLWANATQDPNWGYPKTRDTRSRDYAIRGNRFEGHKVALQVSRTAGVELERNTYLNVARQIEAGPEVSGLTFEPVAARGFAGSALGLLRGPEEMDAMLPPGARRGRDTIIVDEWGPYDYRSPKIWPAGKPGDRPLTLRVLGSPGRWTLTAIRGGRADARAGDVPGEFTVVPAGRGTDLEVGLEYVGAEVVTPRGVAIPAGTPVPVRWTWFEPAIDWAVRWWTFDAASDPLQAPEAFEAKRREAPVRTDTVRRLDYLGSRALAAGLPNDRVTLRAEGRVDLPRGEFELIVISDDGVRVWIDDRLAIDRWSVHGSIVDVVPVAGGRHRLRLDYFEATGWAELQVRFRRR